MLLVVLAERRARRMPVELAFSIFTSTGRPLIRICQSGAFREDWTETMHVDRVWGPDGCLSLNGTQKGRRIDLKGT